MIKQSCSQALFEQVALDFTGRRSRNVGFFDENDLFGLFVAGQRIFTKIEHIGLGQGFVATDDENHGNFAPFRVFLFHDDGRFDTRVDRNDCFDFGGINIFPSGFDHVFHAVDVIIRSG